MTTADTPSKKAQEVFGALAGGGLAGCHRVGEFEFHSNPKRSGLIDVRPFSDLREKQEPMDYFMGGSRARQLLAVVHSD